MNSVCVPVKRVLVAPLDWGLGHATRCMPLIAELVRRGHKVYLAGEGAVRALLQAEFPTLPFLPLPGYRVRYGASALQTTAALLRQLPQILKAVQAEHQWLQAAMKEHRFDIVISDNRYGLHHPQAHSVFITHQLNIQTPVAAADWVVQKAAYHFIEKFDACWVPDFDGEPSLAGALSHPKKKLRIPVCYIGPLSRFVAIGENFQHSDTLLLLLSGPEPQRAIFEKILLQQAADIKQNTVLVRGLPAEKKTMKVASNIEVYHHLPAATLNAAVAAASLVVCRSGYSTVMDLAALRKKSILVPTPGQTEQAYLARHLQQQGFALWRGQQGFNLKEALLAAAVFDYRFLERGNDDLLKAAVEALERQ